MQLKRCYPTFYFFLAFVFQLCFVAFKSATEVFRSHAKTLWQKNIMETWD